MFKKRSESTDILQEERAYNEAIHRLIAARTRVAEQELMWANGEENPNFFTLFGKFAELQWIYNDAAKCMANKQLSVKKAFKNIFQEERILEESRKELQSCNSKLAKLQKQVENAKKKNDPSKVISLETELAAQTTLSEQLQAAVGSQAQKLELYKVKELKRSLLTQAEGVLTLAGHCQQLYAAHMQLIDLMPDAPPTCKGEEANSNATGCLEQRMSEVVTRVSDLLSIHPPLNGGVDPKKLAAGTSSSATPPAPCPGSSSSSPHNFRRSLVDQIGLDIFRNKKDELCPSVPPPAIRPKRLSQKPFNHPVYKVDTREADEVEPGGGRCSPASAPLHSPISLSHITGITIEEASPTRSKPRVDYSQGMYCEIVIPDDGGVSPPLLFNREKQCPPEVPMRRTNSDSPPNDVKHSRNLSLDRNEQMFEQTLKHSKPLDSTTDSETASAQFSSSEDLEVVAAGEVDPGYARVNIRPLSSTGPVVPASSHDSEECGGYANPVDALNFPSEVIEKRFSMGPGALLSEDKPSTGLTEEQKNSPYQSVEDVRKMRELQNHQRHQMKQQNQSNQRSHSVSPNTSRTNLHSQLLQQQQQEANSNEQVNYYDDNPGYSRPFDALSGLPHTKMTVDKNSKVPFTPLPPPAMRRTASGDRPGKERAAKSLHMTTVGGNKESEKAGGPVVADKPRGSSCKKSWKISSEPNSHGNGNVTSPPVPPTDRPRPMEQWQLPSRQKQQEKSAADKSYLRSKSDQSFKNELQATLKKAGANISDHPSRGETGRTSSESAAYRLKTRPPLMNIHQLKAKKLNPTKAN